VLHDCVSHAVRQHSDDYVFQTGEGAVSMLTLSRLVSDDTRFLREAALAGLGIVMLPELLVAEDLAAGRLHRVLDDYLTGDLAVHALHPHGRLAPASVRAFMDHLATIFRAPPAAAPVPAPPRKRARGLSIAMTEQDVRRLTAVAALYADSEPDAASELQQALARTKVTVAAKIPRACLTMNSRVRLEDAHGRGEEVSLAYPWAASSDHVSVLSPFGRALLGAHIGDELRDGTRRKTIVAIPYQPEAAGDHHL
jgi:transcription elongation GreA/GreB family factor